MEADEAKNLLSLVGLGAPRAAYDAHEHDPTFGQRPVPMVGGMRAPAPAPRAPRPAMPAPRAPRAPGPPGPPGNRPIPPHAPPPAGGDWHRRFLRRHPQPVIEQWWPWITRQVEIIPIFAQPMPGCAIGYSQHTLHVVLDDESAQIQPIFSYPSISGGTKPFTLCVPDCPQGQVLYLKTGYMKEGGLIPAWVEASNPFFNQLLRVQLLKGQTPQFACMPPGQGFGQMMAEMERMPTLGQMMAEMERMPRMPPVSDYPGLGAANALTMKAAEMLDEHLTTNGCADCEEGPVGQLMQLTRFFKAACLIDPEISPRVHFDLSTPERENAFDAATLSALSFVLGQKRTYDGIECTDSSGKCFAVVGPKGKQPVVPAKTEPAKPPAAKTDYTPYILAGVGVVAVGTIVVIAMRKRAA